MTLKLASHVSRAQGGLLLPARGEKVGMRGRFRESEPVEAPPHRAEIRFSLGTFSPLFASGARNAAPLRSRSKCQRRHIASAQGRIAMAALRRFDTHEVTNQSP